MFSWATETFTNHFEKSDMGSTWRYIVLFWTNPEKSDPENSSCTTKWLLISYTILVRRTIHSRHSCWWKDKLISEFLHWAPKYGHTIVSRGKKKKKNYQLRTDTGCSLGELSKQWTAEKRWLGRIEGIHLISTTWKWGWWSIIHHLYVLIFIAHMSLPPPLSLSLSLSLS